MTSAKLVSSVLLLFPFQHWNGQEERLSEWRQNRQKLDGGLKKGGGGRTKKAGDWVGDHIFWAQKRPLRGKGFRGLHQPQLCCSLGDGQQGTRAAGFTQTICAVPRCFASPECNIAEVWIHLMVLGGKQSACWDLDEKFLKAQGNIPVMWPVVPGWLQYWSKERGREGRAFLWPLKDFHHTSAKDYVMLDNY